VQVEIPDYQQVEVLVGKPQALKAMDLCLALVQVEALLQQEMAE
jgi:hypothetical protein